MFLNFYLKMLNKIKSKIKEKIKSITPLYKVWFYFKYVNISEGDLGGYIKGGDPETYYPKLWDWIVKELDVQSVLDIGCGEGYSTRYFKKIGCDVLGIEGSSKAIRDSVISNNVIKHDFCKGEYTPNKKYDSIWSCEFVEHIEEKYISNFLETFKFAEKYIFMTFAEKGQEGWHHVNCKTKEYWIKKISQIGFRFDPKLTEFAKSLCKKHFNEHGLVFINQNYKIKKNIKI